MSAQRHLVMILAFLVAVPVFASESDILVKQMKRFELFVGVWNVRATHQLKPGDPFPREFKSEVYYVDDGRVLAVDDSTADRSYRVLGLHTYDSQTGMFLNWGARSFHPVHTTLAEFSESGTWVGRPGRSYKADYHRGEWRLIDTDTLEIAIYKLAADGKEYPVVAAQYTRIK